MNDTYTDIHNPIYDLIIKHIPHNNNHLPTHLHPQPRKESVPHFSHTVILPALPEREHQHNGVQDQISMSNETAPQQRHKQNFNMQKLHKL
jgi:hypothetical protein